MLTKETTEPCARRHKRRRNVSERAPGRQRTTKNEDVDTTKAAACRAAVVDGAWEVVYTGQYSATLRAASNQGNKRIFLAASLKTERHERKGKEKNREDSPVVIEERRGVAATDPESRPAIMAAWRLGTVSASNP